MTNKLIYLVLMKLKEPYKEVLMKTLKMLRDNEDRLFWKNDGPVDIILFFIKKNKEGVLSDIFKWMRDKNPEMLKNVSNILKNM